MTVPSLLDEPGRVDEPGAVQEFSAVLTQVAAEHRPVIVRRNGAGLAAVIPLEHLELVREVLARPEVAALTAEIDWKQARQSLRPPQEWFDGDEPKPFRQSAPPAGAGAQPASPSPHPPAASPPCPQKDGGAALPGDPR